MKIMSSNNCIEDIWNESFFLERMVIKDIHNNILTSRNCISVFQGIYNFDCTCQN